MLNRRTRDRFALGVGGSYGQRDYWLGQVDPASPQEPLRCADSEPRVLKSWKDALTTGSDHLAFELQQKMNCYLRRMVSENNEAIPGFLTSEKKTLGLVKF